MANNLSQESSPRVSSSGESAADGAKPTKRRRRAAGKGASADCFTCQERGIDCDRRRPYCSQCLEIGDVCSGYKTALTWGVGVASRGKLRGLAKPFVESEKAGQSEGSKVASTRSTIVQQTPSEQRGVPYQTKFQAQHDFRSETTSPAPVQHARAKHEPIAPQVHVILGEHKHGEDLAISASTRSDDQLAESSTLRYLDNSSGQATNQAYATYGNNETNFDWCQPTSFSASRTQRWSDRHDAGPSPVQPLQLEGSLALHPARDYGVEPMTASIIGGYGHNFADPQTFVLPDGGYRHYPDRRLETTPPSYNFQQPGALGLHDSALIPPVIGVNPSVSEDPAADLSVGNQFEHSTFPIHDEAFAPRNARYPMTTWPAARFEHDDTLRSSHGGIHLNTNSDLIQANAFSTSAPASISPSGHFATADNVQPGFDFNLQTAPDQYGPSTPDQRQLLALRCDDMVDMSPDTMTSTSLSSTGVFTASPLSQSLIFDNERRGSAASMQSNFLTPSPPRGNPRMQYRQWHDPQSRRRSRPNLPSSLSGQRQVDLAHMSNAMAMSNMHISNVPIRRNSSALQSRSGVKEARRPSQATLAARRPKHASFDGLTQPFMGYDAFDFYASGMNADAKLTDFDLSPGVGLGFHFDDVAWS